MESRFAPTAYDDPRGNLFKLTQTTSVAAYLSAFEALANRIVGLNSLDLLSCFVSGLKTEIRREVLAQQPTSLSQAAGLARLHEDKLQDLHRAFRARPLQQWPPVNSWKAPPPLNPSVPLLPSPAKPRFRQLSEAEMADRREKGLCFNCDQKFHRNHRCPGRVFLMVAEEDDPPSPDSGSILAADSIEDVGSPEGIGPGAEDSHPAQLSLNALSGIPTAETFRVMGRISSRPVHILVDGESSC